MRSWLFLCFCLLSQILAHADENWTQFRGPRGDGQSTSTGLPLKWSEQENIKWKTPIPGKAWSSPVIWEKQVWVTNATEDGKRLSAVCVDRDSGKIVRDVTVFELEKPQFCHGMNSYASSTPVIEAGRLYAHFGSHGTACVDTATGKILWQRTDLLCDHYRGAGSSPVIHENLLIVSYDGYDQQYIVAMDKTSGKTVWKKDRSTKYPSPDGDAKKAYGTVLVLDVKGQTQIVSPAAEATIAYAPENGEEIWKVRHGGMNAAARPLFGNGLLYIATGDGGFRLFAMRPDGSGDVTDSHVEWKSKVAVPTRCSQLLIGDLIFMGNEAGILSCLDAKTGENVWQERVGGNYSASPIFADGRIYFFSQEGVTPVIAPTRAFKLLSENKLDSGFMASPAVAGKAIFLRTKTHLYRVEQ